MSTTTATVYICNKCGHRMVTSTTPIVQCSKCGSYDLSMHPEEEVTIKRTNHR